MVAQLLQWDDLLQIVTSRTRHLQRDCARNRHRRMRQDERNKMRRTTGLSAGQERRQSEIRRRLNTRSPLSNVRRLFVPSASARCFVAVQLPLEGGFPSSNIRSLRCRLRTDTFVRDILPKITIQNSFLLKPHATLSPVQNDPATCQSVVGFIQSEKASKRKRKARTFSLFRPLHYPQGKPRARTLISAPFLPIVACLGRCTVPGGFSWASPRSSRAFPRVLARARRVSSFVLYFDCVCVCLRVDCAWPPPPA